MDGPALPVSTIVRQAARAALASEHVVRVVEDGKLIGIVDDEAILRVVDPIEAPVTEDGFLGAEASESGYVAGARSDAEPTIDPDADTDSKPKA